MSALTILTPDDRTLFEVAELAQRAGVALVHRQGRLALCAEAQVPAGWHRVPLKQHIHTPTPKGTP